MTRPGKAWYVLDENREQKESVDLLDVAPTVSKAGLHNNRNCNQDQGPDRRLQTHR